MAEGFSLFGQLAQDAHDDTAEVIRTAWAHHHDRAMQQRQYQYNYLLNNQMAKLSKQARVQSASDQVEGLKRAGLSPALASGGSFGSVSSGGSVGAPSSGGSPSPRGALGQLALDTMKYNESERVLLQAQARKLNADASSTELDVQNRRDANDVANKVASDYFEQIKRNPSSSDDEVAYANAMLLSPISLGSLQGFDSAMLSYPKMYQSLSERLRHEVDSSVFASQLWDKDFASKVSGIPKQQADKLKAETQNLAFHSALLQAEFLRTNQNTALLKKQMDLITSQIRGIEQTIKATHHSDVIDLFESGEYLNMAIGMGSSALSSTIHALGMLAGGRAMTAGRSSNPAFFRGLSK